MALAEEEDMMFGDVRTRLGVAVMFALTVMMVVACGTEATSGPAMPSAGQSPLSVAPVVPGVLVVPGSSHVTGTYPTSCQRAPGDDPRLPVHACTPGSIRSDIDPNHLELTVCKPGWSDSVRPPTAETNRVKTLAMIAYGIPPELRSTTEFDHDIPESLGGSSHVTNLWPQVSDLPGKGSHNGKDEIENRVHTAVCRNKVSWAAAVEAFARNWVTAEHDLGLPGPR